MSYEEFNDEDEELSESDNAEFDGDGIPDTNEYIKKFQHKLLPRAAEIRLFIQIATAKWLNEYSQYSLRAMRDEVVMCFKIAPDVETFLGYVEKHEKVDGAWTPQAQLLCKALVLRHCYARNPWGSPELEPADWEAWCEPMFEEAKAAREELIRKNMRLVISVARKYYAAISASGNSVIDLSDLIQEGCIGLDKAITKFEFELGFHFSTYATWWIRQSIARYLASFNKTLRVPAHLVEEYNRVLATKSRFMQTEGRNPTMRELVMESKLLTDEEIAELKSVNESGEALNPALRIKYKRAVAKMQKLLIYSEQPLSTNHELSDDEDADQLEDLIPGEEVLPEQAMLSNDVKSRLEAALDKLSERQRIVLKLRYGLKVEGIEQRVYTLDEVGQMFNLTRERIRQIEGEAEKALHRIAIREELLSVEDTMVA